MERHLFASKNELWPANYDLLLMEGIQEANGSWGLLAGDLEHRI